MANIDQLIARAVKHTPKSGDAPEFDYRKSSSDVKKILDKWMEARGKDYVNTNSNHEHFLIEFVNWLEGVFPRKPKKRTRNQTDEQKAAAAKLLGGYKAACKTKGDHDGYKYLANHHGVTEPEYRAWREAGNEGCPSKSFISNHQAESKKLKKK
jgi:hypothetical protein